MKKRFLLALILCGIGISFNLKADVKNSTPIEIGAIYNLTGEQSALDIPAANGAQLAIKNINAAGGILGRPLKLVLIDGKTNKETITSAAKTLADNKNIVAVLGLSDTDMAKAAIPVVANAHKIFLASGATSPKLPTLAPNYVFLACFTDNQQAAAAAEYTVDFLKAKNIAIITEQDMEYSRLLTDYFDKSLHKLGGTVIAKDHFTHVKTDISLQLKQLKNSAVQPDAFFVAAGPLASEIIEQIRDAGFNQPIIGGDSLDTTALQRLDPKTSNNVFYTAHTLYSNNESDKQIKNFITEYKNVFQHDPENSFAGLGYDSVALLAESMKIAKSTDSNKIAEALLKIKFLDVVTGMISYINKNPIPIKTIMIVQIQNGQRVPAKQLTPQTAVE